MNNVAMWIEQNTFYCERMHARIRPDVCMQNQKAAKSGDAARRDSIIDVACINCEQGRRIAMELVKQKNTAQQNRCARCGKPFEPYKQGCVTVKTVCPSCVSIGNPEKRRSPLKVHEIRIDLSKHPDVLEALQKEAEEEFRTLEGQVMWILREYCGRNKNRSS